MPSEVEPKRLNTEGAAWTRSEADRRRRQVDCTCPTARAARGELAGEKTAELAATEGQFLSGALGLGDGWLERLSKELSGLNAAGGEFPGACKLPEATPAPTAESVASGCGGTELFFGEARIDELANCCREAALLTAQLKLFRGHLTQPEPRDQCAILAESSKRLDERLCKLLEVAAAELTDLRLGPARGTKSAPELADLLEKRTNQAAGLARGLLRLACNIGEALGPIDSKQPIDLALQRTLERAALDAAACRRALEALESRLLLLREQ